MSHLAAILPPTEAPVSAQVEDPLLIAVSSPVGGIATHYGAGYSGQTLACGGVYIAGDPTIIAVGSAREGEWGCGAYLNVCGVAGCITGTRLDSCPGCGRYHIDLSEAGMYRVCGPEANVCDVTIQLMRRLEVAATPPPQ